MKLFLLMLLIIFILIPTIILIMIFNHLKKHIKLSFNFKGFKSKTKNPKVNVKKLLSNIKKNKN
jgi:hypothetical protein